MATVNVTSWAEFVQAVGVPGDTVVLPNKAEWDMNELYPEGYTGTINTKCSQINGNGTKIKNLHLFGCFVKTRNVSVTINDLEMTNFVVEPVDASYNAVFTGFSQLNLHNCIFSGLCGSYISSFSVGYLYLDRASMNINFTTSANSFGVFPVQDAKYSRIKQSIPNAIATSTDKWFGTCKFCELDVYMPQLAAGKLNVSNLSACKLLGGYGDATFYENSASSAREFPSIYLTDAIPDAIDGQYMRGVTRDQMRDAAYLASLGFPVGV